LLGAAVDDDLRAGARAAVERDVGDAAMRAGDERVLPARLRLERRRTAAGRAVVDAEIVPDDFAVPRRGRRVELGAGDRRHVLRRGRPARRDAAVAALVGAVVTGRDRERLTLRGGLREDLVVRSGRAVVLRGRFAFADRDVDDLHRVRRDDRVEV